MWFKTSAFSIIIIAGLRVTDGQSQLPIAWSDNSIGPLLRAKMAVPPGRVGSVDDVILRFYNGTTPDEVVSFRLPEAKALLAHPGFNRSAPTVLYIHGYIELFTDESVRTVAAAYLDGKRGYNIVSLDWSNMAYGQYLNGALNVKPVGIATARQLVRLVSSRRGVRLDRVHIVGHSLGAHIAGQIGRSMKKAGLTLPRISAVDPAFPGFYPALLGLPLRPGDAQFVDALHTDGGLYGTPLHVAHVDFWPNGGFGKQPGCDPVTVVFSFEDFCSHHRSWRFWAESVRTAKSFPARRCEDYKSFYRNECNEQQLAYMGHDADATLRGDFYLTTGDKSPFSQKPRQRA